MKLINQVQVCKKKNFMLWKKSPVQTRQKHQRNWNNWPTRTTRKKLAVTKWLWNSASCQFLKDAEQLYLSSPASNPFITITPQTPTKKCMLGAELGESKGQMVFLQVKVRDCLPHPSFPFFFNNLHALPGPSHPQWKTRALISVEASLPFMLKQGKGRRCVCDDGDNDNNDDGSATQF